MGWTNYPSLLIADAIEFGKFVPQFVWMRADWMLAQAKGGESTEGSTAIPAASAPGIFEQIMSNPLYLFTIVLGLFYLMVVMPQQSSSRSHQRNLAQSLKDLKKNDRVLTAAGIYGVVVNVAPDTGIVSIRVDEATNAKLSITRESIVKVICDDTSADKSK